MAYSVLILDDDADFNSLLTDIFEQADYQVTSLEDPLEAVDVFRDTHFDLVVTDHKMPGMTGAEFLKVVKKMKPDVPVIMVSGYLENDTIRELISDGVGGVFLKPLNIFSLLERTAELLDEAQSVSQGGASEDSLDDEGAAKNLGFSFRSFPCKSPLSLQFAERLHGLRNFKSTLSLIGSRGCNYRSICEDIRGFYESEEECFIYLDTASFEEESTIKQINDAKAQGAERVTCVLLNLEEMSDAQKLSASALAKCEGAFDVKGVGMRTIFCVTGDLDDLFDQTLIDESLYILMGTAKVQVPALNECAQDIPGVAQHLIVEHARAQKLGSVPRFDHSAREFLQSHSWDGNYEELNTLVLALLAANHGDMIDAGAVQLVLDNDALATPSVRALTHLSGQRVDYARAVHTLFDGDMTKLAQFFGADHDKAQAILK